CHDGFVDHDNDPTNGCEINTTNDVNNCGPVGNIYNLNDAFAACVISQCAVASCHDGFVDHDNNPTNGCEINTTIDVNNCGIVGNICILDNAFAACVASQCPVASCHDGFVDHDNNPTNGCEINTTNDVNN